MGKKSADNLDKEWETHLRKINFKEDEDSSSDGQKETDKAFKPINVGFIEGKLISKKKGVGTLSEGNVYYIIPDDQHGERWNEIIVRKKGLLWQVDQQLNPYVGKSVRIKGDIIETRSSITVDCIEISEKKTFLK